MNGEVLLVDKPLGWTSFQVVNKLRYALSKAYNKKKFKVGHAGTLDPLATGLLVLCTGKMTKQIQFLIQDDKGYEGTIQLGTTTPSFDLETEVNATFSTEHIDQEKVLQVQTEFIGAQMQLPPIFSAKRINGKRAYDLARAGEDVQLTKASIVIHDLQLELREDKEIHFKTHCSKGTYIRSLANNIGKSLKSGAHLTSLRRTRSGNFHIDDAKSIEDWITIIQNNPITPTK